MRRIILFFSALSLLLSCGDDAAEQAAKARRERHIADSLALKVAVTPTLDCLPLFLAQEEGWFDREGLSVQLREYQAQMDQDTALLRHHVEGMTTDSIRTKWVEQQGAKVRTVAQTSLKWQLVSNKTARIMLLQQLDDKMVAMTRFSATDWLASHAVDSARLQQERVFRIQVNDIGVRLSMLENGIMDAMLLPEPQATQARLGGHHVLMDTDSLGFHAGVIVFSEAAMADTMRQKQVEQFVTIYERACDTIAARGTKSYKDIIVKYCHVRPEVADSIKS